MQIERIFVYPVKSLKGIEVRESRVDEYGFEYDRMYALAYPTRDGSYAVLTQRQEASLARISTAIAGADIVMQYAAGAGRREARLPLDTAALPQNMPAREMEFLGSNMVCSDVGAARPELKQFFAEFLADKPKYADVTVITSKVRRVVPSAGAATDAFVRESQRRFHSSFQDYFPGTLMTTASCEDIEQRIEMRTDEKVDSQGYRMNMLVRTDEPWIEDDWQRLRIGAHEWFVDRLCERCATTLVDQERGVVRQSKQPVTELNRFRVMHKGGRACFGLNLYSKDHGFVVRVGDSVEVLETTD